MAEFIYKNVSNAPLHGCCNNSIDNDTAGAAAAVVVSRFWIAYKKQGHCIPYWIIVIESRPYYNYV